MLSRPRARYAVPTEIPRWYRAALHVPIEDAEVTVAGAQIHYLAWGEPGRRGLLFVHGGAAHAHWWRHVAATFAADCRVAAIDLSGHGDSDRRTTYSLELWAEEIVAVARAAAFDGLPLVIAHSMGGAISLATAGLHPAEIGGVIVCDSPVNRPDPEVDSFRRGSAFGPLRLYPSREAALAHFRVVPEQEGNLEYVIADIAQESIRTADGGWQWKYDPAIFDSFGHGVRAAAHPYLSQVECRVALLRSEYGLVTESISAEMYELLGRVAPVIELPATGHHPMLDQPLVLLAALRALLADWDHSEPHRRPEGM
jgi:pimeloyl-ACP methyl ester carboxylesterase